MMSDYASPHYRLESPESGRLDDKLQYLTAIPHKGTHVLCQATSRERVKPESDGETEIQRCQILAQA